MTLSVPSFLASATRASMPPAACAEVQVAAPLAALPEALLDGAGGAHPAPRRTSPVVTAASAVILEPIFVLVFVVRMCGSDPPSRAPPRRALLLVGPEPGARSVQRMTRPRRSAAPRLARSGERSATDSAERPVGVAGTDPRWAGSSGGNPRSVRDVLAQPVTG